MVDKKKKDQKGKNKTGSKRRRRVNPLMCGPGILLASKEKKDTGQKTKWKSQ